MLQRDKSCYLLKIKRLLGSQKKKPFAGAFCIVSSFHKNTRLKLGGNPAWHLWDLPSQGRVSPAKIKLLKRLDLLPHGK